MNGSSEGALRIANTSRMDKRGRNLPWRWRWWYSFHWRNNGLDSLSYWSIVSFRRSSFGCRTKIWNETSNRDLRYILIDTFYQKISDEPQRGISNVDQFCLKMVGSIGSERSIRWKMPSTTIKQTRCVGFVHSWIIDRQSTSVETVEATVVMIVPLLKKNP